MNRRVFLSLPCLLALSGCGGAVVDVGEVAKLKPFDSSDNKTWVATDQESLLAFDKSKAEFDELFDRLRDEKRIFRQIQGTRIKVLERKEIAKNAWVVRGEILTEANIGKELWINEDKIEPDSP